MPPTSPTVNASKNLRFNVGPILLNPNDRKFVVGSPVEKYGVLPANSGGNIKTHRTAAIMYRMTFLFRGAHSIFDI
jgi:hypothetical protein